MTLLRLFALVMEGFFEKSPVEGIVHLCIVKDVWLETYVLCEPELNFSTPNFPHMDSRCLSQQPSSGDGTVASVISGFVGSGGISWSSQRPEKDHSIHGMLRGPGNSAGFPVGMGNPCFFWGWNFSTQICGSQQKHRKT